MALTASTLPVLSVCSLVAVIGNHEPAAIVTVAEDQRQCLMGFHGCSQSRQLHIGYTIMLMENQSYLDFVQPVADELQAGLPRCGHAPA